MRRYVRARGVSIALLGDGWVAHSATSGETHLLNDESAALVDLLNESRPRAAAEVAAELAVDCGLDAAALESTLGPAWSMLIDGGLVRECRDGPPGAG